MTSIYDLYGPTFFDAIGIAGFGLYVLNYTMLTFQRVKSESIVYFVINGAAACMVLIGLTNAFNLAAAMIQIFFICISCVAILVRLREKHAARSALQY
jgi:predicted membrane protein